MEEAGTLRSPFAMTKGTILRTTKALIGLIEGQKDRHIIILGKRNFRIWKWKIMIGMLIIR